MRPYALVLLLAVACGGGDGGGASRDVFVAEVNRLCRDHETVDPAAEFTPDTAARLARDMRELVGEVRAVPVGEADQQAVDARFLEPYGRAADLVEEAGVPRGDDLTKEDADRRVQLAFRLTEELATVRAFHEEYGLTDCLRP